MSALRVGAVVLLAAGLSAVLGGCGDAADPGPQARAVAARSIAIDYASYYPPAEQLRRLVRARARTRGARVTFSDDAAGRDAQLAAFKAFTSERSGFRVVAVAPFDPAALDPLAVAALERGVQIVSFAVPLDHESATIDVDPTRAGRLLARHALGWAARVIPDGGDVLILRPPAARDTPDQFAALARPWERGVLDELAHGTTLRPVAATTAQSQADAEAAVARALRDYPDVRVVLSWNDTTAVGAARALRRAHPRAAWGTLYAGGQGAPAIASAASLDALRNDPVLRSLVAPRLRELADALVDVPFALLRGRPPRDVVVPLVLLTESSPELPAFARDYGA